MRKLFLSTDCEPSDFDGSYLLLDNDFLSGIFENEVFFQWFVTKFEKSYFFIDRFTAFEFVRDTFEPEARRYAEKFITNDEVFYPTLQHQELFKPIHDNALLLSRLYAHQRKKQNLSGNPGFVDLHLAGRVMQYPHELIVTGNIKDYPTVIFDIKGTISIEKKDGGIKNYAFLEFNREKFEVCLKDYEVMLKTRPRGRVASVST